jgi:hypothetical protein
MLVPTSRAHCAIRVDLICSGYVRIATPHHSAAAPQRIFRADLRAAVM